MLTEPSDPMHRARQKCGTTEIVLTPMREVITEAADVRFCWPARASGYHLAGRSHGFVNSVLAPTLSICSFRMDRSPPVAMRAELGGSAAVDCLVLRIQNKQIVGHGPSWPRQ